MESAKRRWTHQDEVDTLKEYRKQWKAGKVNLEDFEERLKSSYLEGRLYLQEYKDIIKEQDLSE